MYSHYWLGVLLATKDDEQVGRYLCLVFFGKLCNLLLFNLLECHLNHADSAVDNLFFRGDNSLGLLFLEHGGSNFISKGQMGYFSLTNFDANLVNTVLDRLTERFAHLVWTSP